MDYDPYDDQALVDGILNKDRRLIEYFFNKECSELFGHFIIQVFGYRLMERYAVTVDKKSLIKNDPNDWSREHHDPRYILSLLLSVININCQTVDIVNSLPKLEF